MSTKQEASEEDDCVEGGFKRNKSVAYFGEKGYKIMNKHKGFFYSKNKHRFVRVLLMFLHKTCCFPTKTCH